MLIASLHGRLGADPVERQTKAGKPMTTVSVAVDVAGKDAEPATLWVGVLAFGTAAAALLRARKGETVSAMGRLTRGSYTGKDGAEREQWTLLAEAVIVARSARPTGPPRVGAPTGGRTATNRPSATWRGGPDWEGGTGPAFDDEIPPF